MLNLPQRATAKEVWHHFGRNKNILDIILPKKRDVNGNKYGFIKLKPWREIKNLIEEMGNTSFQGYRMSLKMAATHRSRTS